MKRWWLLYALTLLLLALYVLWILRGITPETKCKQGGGFYSNAYRTCMYAEPPAAPIRNVGH